MTQPINLPTPASNGTPNAPKTGTTIQPGVYNMRATDAELGYTQGSDTAQAAPQVAVLFEFIDGPYKGLSITWYGFFTDKTKASTFRALRTIGWTGDDLSDLSSARGEAPCTVTVETDLQGVLQARIRFVGGGAIAMKNVMTEEQKKAFAESMKGFAASIQNTTTTDEKKPGGKFF